MKFSLKEKKTGIAVFLILFLFFLLNFSSIHKGIKNFFYSLSWPVQTMFLRGGEKASGFLEVFFKAQSFQKENEELKLKISELLVEKIDKIRLERENKALRQALELGLEKDFEFKIAEVGGKDISEDFVLIDKGAKDGILEGLPVITHQKVLVGSIGEVYKNFSKVMLISNKNSSLDVKVLGKEAEGLLRGKGNFQLSLELLPKDKEFEGGDLVVTTFLSGLYPKELLVGEIKEVKKEDIQPFQVAEVKPAFEISEIDFLFIITDF